MTPVVSRQAVLVLLTALVLLVPFVVSAAPGIGQPAPEFSAVTTKGDTVSLEGFRGHVVVLDFFASWCAPCRHSVPHLADMNRKYARQGLLILGMSVDDAGQALSRFMDDLHVNYPVVIAGDSVQFSYGIRSVPVAYVIDKKGRVAGRFMGYTDEIGRSIESLAKRLLADK